MKQLRRATLSGGKRLLLMLLLLLMGGAIVNVAVAWGCVKSDVYYGLTTGSRGELRWHRSIYMHATYATIEAAGWPARAIECHNDILTRSVIWPGFAINTIFYGAILWGLLAAPLALRRRRRIKRGLCPACAYPIGTSPVCTECGKPVVMGKSLS